jgi:histidyl-tRNA synthetase
MERNIKKQLSYANDINADIAVIVGKKELQEGVVTVKDMKTGEQKTLSIQQLIAELRS